ncbi:sporulation protein [Nocardiopsis sp. NPDC050513]|uniref:sporulation protein n=1 Tax=Nocardiopsis sp. NPDC050513 TaxID=3364338 RepID=UPI003791EE67
MVFKRILAGIGVGGASVETTLDTPAVQPGGVVRGTVHIQAGDVEQRIDELTVGLESRVEVESGDHEYSRNVEFQRVRVGGQAVISPGQSFQVPFELHVPFEAPLTSVRGRRLFPMNVGVNTRLSLAGAVDPGDLDPVAIEPLPAQLAFLDALATIGFQFKHADLEQGRILRTRQTLPFYQEIEYYAARQYEGLNALELSFVADHHGMDVVLELDKKRGLLFSEGSDSYHHVTVTHQEGASRDWAGFLHQWIDSLAGRRRLF